MFDVTSYLLGKIAGGGGGGAPILFGETVPSNDLGVDGDSYFQYEESSVYALIAEFSFTGGEQTFTAENDGDYRFVLYGAQGGSTGDDFTEGKGGKGGMASGTVTLSADDTLYIYVGGAGSSVNLTPQTANAVIPGGYNGGGDGYSVPGNYGGTPYRGSGGGCSSLAWSSGLLSSFSEDPSDVILVAAGGGAAGMYNNDEYGDGGAGGGENGSDGTTTRPGGTGTLGSGATQSAGGTGYTSGSFGQGGSCGPISTYGGNGGGGGWYGGGSSRNSWGAGGGSSYLGSVSDPATESGVNEGDGSVSVYQISTGFVVKNTYVKINGSWARASAT